MLSSAERVPLQKIDTNKSDHRILPGSSINAHNLSMLMKLLSTNKPLPSKPPLPVQDRREAGEQQDQLSSASKNCDQKSVNVSLFLDKSQNSNQPAQSFSLGICRPRPSIFTPSPNVLKPTIVARPNGSAALGVSRVGPQNRNSNSHLDLVSNLSLSTLQSAFRKPSEAKPADLVRSLFLQPSNSQKVKKSVIQQTNVTMAFHDLFASPDRKKKRQQELQE